MTVLPPLDRALGSTVQVGDLRLHVRRGGRGPGLLCLHGIGSGAVSFDAQVAGLADLRDVAAWDAPGYGQSDDPAAAPTMEGYADLAAALIREVWGERVDVLGASWGGVIATMLALRHPDLVDRLILLDSTRGSGGSAASASSMRKRAAELAEIGARAFAHQRTPRLLSANADQETQALARRTMADSIRLPGYEYAASSMADTWLDAELEGVTARTLVVCGSEDVVTGPRESEALANRIPGARLVVVPRTGHLANVETPGAVNAAIRTFLTTTDEVVT